MLGVSDEVAAAVATPVLLGAGSVGGWWLRGGRRKARIDAAAAITAASTAVVQLVESQLPALTARVDAAEARAGAAEARAVQAEQHVALLVRTVQVQQAAGAELRRWSQRAAEALRAAHIEIEDPPEMPDIVIPVSIHTTTTTTTRLEA